MSDVYEPDEVVEKILQATWNKQPAVIVPSPPGAGKSGTAERVIYAIAGLAQRRVLVAGMTNTQVEELALRTARAYPQLPVAWLARRGLTDLDIENKPTNLHIINKISELLPETNVVFATTKKWETISPKDIRSFNSQLTETNSDEYAEDTGGIEATEDMRISRGVREDSEDLTQETFGDLLIVDEAWQCPDVDFAHIAWLASRYLLVGDPGQISPVMTVDVTRWRHRADGPHQPAPVALLKRHEKNSEALEVLALPATRRFGQDTTDFVQPAFYPEMPFYSVRPPRYVKFEKKPSSQIEELLSKFGPEKEIFMGELPSESVAINDVTLAQTIADIVDSIIKNMTVTETNKKTVTRNLEPSDVGVVCAHIAQVASVQSALNNEYHKVWVDTAERWQGAEREIIVVWDPLAGKTDLSTFSKDAGRLCVMMSRHRSGCILVTRQGTEELLTYAASGGERILSFDVEDPHFSAWRAQTTLRAMLRKRSVPLID